MTTFQTSRTFAATPAQIFAAFQPARLARWWGPDGFTNTFEICDFKPGGRWLFTMHGPDGKNYLNENVFLEIEPQKRVVIQHIPVPKFLLTITLEPAQDGTLLDWVQELEDPEFARAVAHIIVPANEQNLDRLTVELGRGA